MEVIEEEKQATIPLAPPAPLAAAAAAASVAATTTATIVTEPRAKQVKESTRVEALFCKYSKQLGDVNDRKDRLVKCSRDLTASSKKLIFRALQSIPGARPESEKAVSTLLGMQNALLGLFVPIEEELASAASSSSSSKEEAKKSVYWRYYRQISPGVQEFVEAYGLLWYLREGTLVTREAVEAAVHEALGKALGGEGGSGVWATEITVEDYLLGVLDLTGEVMRHGVSASAGDISVCERDCAFVSGICAAFGTIELHSADYQKKLETLHASLTKLEKVLYGYRLSHAEVIAQN